MGGGLSWYRCREEWKLLEGARILFKIMYLSSDITVAYVSLYWLHLVTFERI